MTSPLHGIRRTARGFTLIELLIVIAIILLLAGLLLPAVSLARRHAKRAAASTEVKNIEATWRQYYSEYERWPSFVEDESEHCISGGVARVIMGGGGADNPHGLRLLDFKRLNASGSPVSPWADIALDDGATYTAAAPEDGAYFYWVKFDADYDNRIPADTGGDTSVLEPLSNAIQRTVVVWTVNPNFEPGHPGYIIGSWQ